MGQSVKKRRQQQRIRKRVKTEPINHEILNSISSPNPWTPKIEEAWLKELRKLSGGEIYRKFPPLKKPPSVRQRAAGSGWGG